MNDILLDNNLDLLIVNGDFVVDNADEQIQELLLIANQGSFRESPLTGVALVNYLKKQFTPTQVDALKQTIQLQWLYDGFTSANVTINSFSDIEIDAQR